MKKIFPSIIIIGYFTISILASELKMNEPISPLPISEPPNAEVLLKIKLGKALFFDKNLSIDRTISCESCHHLSSGGADHHPNSTGVGGIKGEINSPTVFNSAYNFKQFWNGRANTLEEQVDGPITHPKEMGMNWKELIKRVESNPLYKEQFKNAFKEGIIKESIKSAITLFEKSLTTPNARFDQYLEGKIDLSFTEKKGYKLFKDYGCIACHQGVNVGGNMFQTMGVMGNYFEDRKTPITEADLGRYSVTKIESDKYVFRVPSLRNVALTAPYFHDGSVVTLDEAVKKMAYYQLGLKLTTEEIKNIVAFLKTLTGETPRTAEEHFPL